MSHARRLLFAFACAWPAAAHAQGAEPLTFARALARARQESFSVQSARLAAESAKADVKIQSHANDAKLTAEIAAGFVRPETKPVGGGRTETLNRFTDSRSVGARASWTVYDFGRQSAAMSAKESLAGAATASADEEETFLTWKVARAYHGALSALRLERLAREQLGLSDARRRDVERNYRNGLASEYELVSADIERGRLVIALASAEADRQSALLSLCLAMRCGGDADAAALAQAFPASSLPLKSWEDYRATMDAWTRQIADATRERRQRQEDALAAQRRAVDAEDRPRVDLGLGSTWAGKSGGALKEQTSATVSLTWDIPWSGKGRDAMAKLAVAGAQQSLAARSEDTALSDQEALAVKRFEDLGRQWRVLKEQMNLARRQDALVKKRYNAGRASILEVNTAETDRLKLETDEIKLGNQMVAALIDVAEARRATAVEALFP